MRRLEAPDGNPVFRTGAEAAAAAGFAAFAGTNKPEPKTRKRNWKVAAERAVEEARICIATSVENPWTEPKHLVGLYVVLHENVYKVLPEELLGDVWPGAVSAAKKLADELGGLETAVEFLRWVWTRERARERKREPGDSFRIGWRLQFVSRALVTDWKVDRARGARPNHAPGGEKR